MDDVIISTRLTQEQALALAQFLKRLGWSEVRENTKDLEEANQARDALISIQNSLLSRGFDPR